MSPRDSGSERTSAVKIPGVNPFIKEPDYERPITPIVTPPVTAQKDSEPVDKEVKEPVVTDTPVVKNDIGQLANAIIANDPNDNVNKFILENPDSFSPIDVLQAQAVDDYKTGAVTESAFSFDNNNGNQLGDAYALLEDTMRLWDIEGLADELKNYLTEGYTAAEALIKLKTNPIGSYAARFSGNAARVKAGLNAISESSYLDLEDSYASTLKEYGLGYLLSTDKDINRRRFAGYIGNNIEAPQFATRIKNATEFVNGDPRIVDTFKKYYPSLSNTDLIGMFLDPATSIPILERKIAASKIGTAASGFGLGIDEQRANMLAGSGIDYATAQEGYKNIAQEILPTSKKLSDVYKEEKINYDQKTAEQEQFNLVGSTEAANQRKLLQSKERASFSASAGNAPSGYSTSYLKKSNSAGQI